MCEPKRFGTHNGLTLSLVRPVEGYLTGTFVIVNPIRSGMRGEICLERIREGSLLFAKTPDGKTIALLKGDLI